MSLHFLNLRIKYRRTLFPMFSSPVENTPKHGLVQICETFQKHNRKKTPDFEYSFSGLDIFSFQITLCHSPLPVWVAIADEWGSEEAMGAACNSPNGISTTNLKTLNLNPHACKYNYNRDVSIPPLTS